MGGCCSKDDAVGKALWRRAEKVLEDEYFYDGDMDGAVHLSQDGARVRSESFCGFASTYMQRGSKGVNQDAMVLWEDFGGEKGSVFCGVFDGHGPFGHTVAGHVRDNLPFKLSSHLKAVASYEDYRGDAYLRSTNQNSMKCNDTPEFYEANYTAANDKRWSSWKHIFNNAFEELDNELCMNTGIDCICSGTTAVSVIKTREHLFVANLGDSRAILGTRGEKNKLVPVQLTVDHKPNLPDEAKRINNCNGRVFALKEEPDVHRIWLPDDDFPGLAMARAFGDFCLKEYGLISTPHLTSWNLTEKDEFVVLATDGLWDVLSNKQVVKTVTSAKNRTDAAMLLVLRAVRAWRTKYPTSKIDDCAVICLFLKHPHLSSQYSYDCINRTAKSQELSSSESFETARSSETLETEVVSGVKQEGWTALKGFSRANTLVKLPRFARSLSRRLRLVNNVKEQDSKQE